MIGFGLASDWLSRWREFLNQSQNVVKQNQFRITFDTQLKTAPTIREYGITKSTSQKNYSPLVSPLYKDTNSTEFRKCHSLLPGVYQSIVKQKSIIIGFFPRQI